MNVYICCGQEIGLEIQPSALDTKKQGTKQNISKDSHTMHHTPMQTKTERAYHIQYGAMIRVSVTKYVSNVTNAVCSVLSSLAFKETNSFRRSLLGLIVVGIGTGSGLNDGIIDLEDDVVGSQWSHGSVWCLCKRACTHLFLLVGGCPAGLLHNWHDGIGRGGISHNRSSILGMQHLIMHVCTPILVL